MPIARRLVEASGPDFAYADRQIANDPAFFARYNRPHATASWGTMAKDWEAGVDYRKLAQDRLHRARNSIRSAGLGGVLCFNVDNVRYITATHIGEWARDKFDRYCVCPADGDPFGSGSPGQAQELTVAWRPPRRSDLDVARRHTAGLWRGDRVRAPDQAQAGRPRHREAADRHRPDGAVNAARARSRRHRDRRRSASDA